MKENRSMFIYCHTNYNKWWDCVTLYTFLLLDDDLKYLCQNYFDINSSK